MSNVELAYRSDTSVNKLFDLSKIKDRNVSRALATNINCPSQILIDLSNHKDFQVRQYVAENPNTPIHILEKIILNNNETLLYRNVSVNPNCPGELLEKLYEDKDCSYLMNILKHKNCPKEILIKEYRSNYYFIGDKIYYNRIIASNLNTPIDILIELSKDKDSSIRSKVAENINTPLEILIILSKDENERVMAYAKKNRANRIGLLK